MENTQANTRTENQDNELILAKKEIEKLKEANSILEADKKSLTNETLIHLNTIKNLEAVH